jgi:hypothetical protein
VLCGANAAAGAECSVAGTEGSFVDGAASLADPSLADPEAPLPASLADPDALLGGALGGSLGTPPL